MVTATADAPPLRLDGARKHYGTIVALDGVTFDVRPGELVGLLGPNGAGKTTAIKAIAGRVALDGGTVHLFGRALMPRDPRPEIGVVPQELAVYPKLTARENLEVFGELYGVASPALKSRADWALEWSDLKDRAQEPVGRFSGGMKRRLNIACSLLHSPSIVLLDEPTVGVDPAEPRAHLRDAGRAPEIRRLRRPHDASPGGSRTAVRTHPHHRSWAHRGERYARRTGAFEPGQSPIGSRRARRAVARIRGSSRRRAGRRRWPVDSGGAAGSGREPGAADRWHRPRGPECEGRPIDGFDPA